MRDGIAVLRGETIPADVAAGRSQHQAEVQRCNGSVRTQTLHPCTSGGAKRSRQVTQKLSGSRCQCSITEPPITSAEVTTDRLSEVISPFRQDSARADAWRNGEMRANRTWWQRWLVWRWLSQRLRFRRYRFQRR